MTKDHSVPSGKAEFKAYRAGVLMLHCWTSSPSAFAAEVGAFQARLNRFDLSRVEVAPGGQEPAFTLHPMVSEGSQ